MKSKNDNLADFDCISIPNLTTGRSSFMAQYLVSQTGVFKIALLFILRCILELTSLDRHTKRGTVRLIQDLKSTSLFSNV